MTEAKRVKRRRKAAVAAAALLFLSFLPSSLARGKFPPGTGVGEREAGVAGRPTDHSIIEPRRREGRGRGGEKMMTFRQSKKNFKIVLRD